MGFILGLRLLRTSHLPPSGWRQSGERGWGGGGQGEEAFISGSHSATFSHLYRALSLSVHLSLPSSSSGHQSLFLPHPPCLSLFLVGLQDVLFWGPGSPLIESGSRESLADWDQDFQGLRRGRGRHRGVPASELGVRAEPSFCPSSHYFLGPLSPWRLLCFGPTEAHLASVTSASPGRSGAGQAQAP